MALVDNLVSYYNFEQNSDDSKSSNDGTNVAILWQRVHNNFSAVFDGQISRITIPNDASLQITGDLTISFFIQPTDIGGLQEIVDKSPDDEYDVALLSNGDLRFSHGNGTTAETFNLLDVSTYLANNEKAHIVVVRDATLGRIYSYKNGQQILNTTYSSTITTSTDDVGIGSAPDTTNLFTGSLDEIGIWNGALDSDEVAVLYNEGKVLVYDSASDSFVENGGHKRYSLLVQGGSGSSFWTNLADQDRYLDQDNITVTIGGLRGEYYDNIDFTNLTLTRTDSTVDFDWGTGSPDPSIGVNEFSIRWTGYIRPEYSETYTLYIGSDDGTRLYIEGQLIIDNWADQAYNQESTTIVLQANRFYEVEIEYYENSGGAEVDFYWESASQAYEVVPSDRLYNAVSNLSYNVYSTISGWQSAKVRNLANHKEKEILDVRGQWTSSIAEVNLSGWTTDIDEDYYVVIQALELSRPPNIYNNPTLPAHFRIVSTQATSPAIIVNDFSLELKNIQAESQADVIRVNTNANDTVRLLYSQIRNTDQSSTGVIANQNAGRLEVVSSVIINSQSGVLATTNNTGVVYILDSTITQCTNGITTNGTDVRPSSNAIFNNVDDFNGTFPENWPKYCASDDNDVGVSGIDISPGATESTDWNDAFVDYTNGDFRIVDDQSPLYDAGEPNVAGAYYATEEIPYLDVGNAPRVRRDVGAFSFTDWWDYRFIERIQITVPASLVPTDLTDFTLYIDLQKVNAFSGLWSRSDPTGLDLRISSENTRDRIPQELVFFDIDDKDGEIWGKGELSGTSDTTFYVYYNFTNFPEEPSTPDYPPDNNVKGQYEVWSDYEAVWHLQDLTIEDATGNGYDGTVRGTPSVVTDGRFGYSIEWNETGAGNQESADVGNIATDASWTAITVESWFRKDTTGDERMICKSDGGTSVTDHIFALHSQTGFQAISVRMSTDTTDAFTFDGNTAFTTGEWNFAATNWSAADDTLRLFLNGQGDGTAAHTGNHVRTSSQQVEIANVNNSTTDRFWEGGLDEIRVAKVQFPNYQERLETQYNNQTSEAFGDAAPQPETNPVLPPAQDVDVVGSWTAVSTTGTQLTIDVDIPTLTGKLALVIGTSNESSATDSVSSITLDGQNPTQADQARQGTGFSNTAEIWYFLDDELPTTPGTYTLTINFTNNGLDAFGATAVLYDTILQQAPDTYTDNGAGITTISNDVTIDTTNVNANLAFEVISAGDSNNSTPGADQIEISDVTVGTAAIATSQALYEVDGTETVSRTMDASTNRLAQVVAVWKSGEEAVYNYLPFGGIILSGAIDASVVDKIAVTPAGGAVFAGAAETDIEFARTGDGGAVFAGAAVIALEFIITIVPAPIVLSGAPNYFPSIARTGAGSLITAGAVNEADFIEMVFEVIGSAFHLGGGDYFIEFVREGEGVILTTQGAVEEADTIDITFIDLGGTIQIGGQPEYFPQFTREGAGSAVFAGAVERDLIFTREGAGSAVFAGAVERDLIFTREGAGSAVFAGNADDDFQLVSLYFPEDGIITLSGAANYDGGLGVNYNPTGGYQLLGAIENTVIIAIFIDVGGTAIFAGETLLILDGLSPDLEYGQISLDYPEVIVFADYEPHYVYQPKLPGAPNLRFKGGAAWQIEESEYYYQASGKALFKGQTVYTFFANKTYLAQGGFEFPRTHNLTQYSHATSNYFYIAVPGSLILSGAIPGRKFIILAQEPSGSLEFSGDGDLVADVVVWEYSYLASGKLKTKITSAPVEYSVNLHYPVNIGVLRFGGTAGIGIRSRLYEYVASGGYEFLSARFFSWESTGKLLFSGTVGTVGAGTTLEKSFIYVGSGKVSFDYPGVQAQAEYDPYFIYTGKGRIRFSGTAEAETNYSYESSGSLTFAGTGETVFEIARVADTTGVSIIFSGTTERYAEYIEPVIGGEISIVGDAEETLVYIYEASGKLLIAGQSNFVFQEYEASGGFTLSFPTGITTIVIRAFIYEAVGKLKFVRTVITLREVEYESSIRTLKLRFKGTAVSELADIVFPVYEASGTITTAGVSATAHSVLYSYEASGSAVFAGAADTESSAKYSYEASGSAVFAGAADTTIDALSYLYAAAGLMLFDGTSGSVGQDFYEYTATGSLNSFGQTQVNYRFVIETLTNITQAPRSLREPLAQKVFTFYTNE